MLDYLPTLQLTLTLITGTKHQRVILFVPLASDCTHHALSSPLVRMSYSICIPGWDRLKHIFLKKHDYIQKSVFVYIDVINKTFLLSNSCMVVRQYFQPLCIVLQSDFKSIWLDVIISLETCVSHQKINRKNPVTQRKDRL